MVGSSSGLKHIDISDGAGEEVGKALEKAIKDSPAPK